MFNEHVQSRSAQQAATRQRVLAAAEQLFRTRGFKATTIRQIAAEANVSTGTVMAAGEKDALLVSIFDNWISSVHNSRQTDLTPSTETATTEDVLRLFEPFVGYFALDSELSREYLAVLVRGTHQSVIFRDLALALLGELETVLARTTLPVSQVGPGARTIYLAYLGLLMTAASGAIAMPEAADQLRQTIEFVIAHPEGNQ
ncbi:TetR/AcrR family transcriptional regulator [Nocardia caishijiensis]|uniref:TetR family transcriptional regulator n=1 Tax=Nocardia caishijiensis TaxID=184756 RepID=A0ABQ6YN45_9NOCA|nr:TetR/AcrR family transcriptional regulator [Nocardia caishijiensis]KAF0846919.1 TetR family transcriptional regulator [Nocardia caishijiensis]